MGTPGLRQQGMKIVARLPRVPRAGNRNIAIAGALAQVDAGRFVDLNSERRAHDQELDHSPHPS